MQILIVDDDAALCRSLQIQLEGEGHEVSCVHLAEDGIRYIRERNPELAFVDLKLPDRSGLEVLSAIAQLHSPTVPVMITGVQDTKATIDAIRHGAYDYIRKPLDMDVVQFTLEKVAQHRIRSKRKGSDILVDAPGEPGELVGAHPSIILVLKRVALLSENRLPVLILGESGTGKELVARALHCASSPGSSFVAVNCSAVVSTLLESELFGHTKGAFTGAETTTTGKFEIAKDGTVFLDEIGDMSFELQSKLLRVLEMREFERVGATTPIPLKARIVAATHRDLPAMVEKGEFREDLYFRLSVTTITIPPLRERMSDLPLLISHILGRLNRDLQRKVTEIEQAGLELMQSYDWPGNVRELVNVLTRAMLLTRGDTITAEAVHQAALPPTKQSFTPDSIKTLRAVEREHVLAALLATGWNITRTAELLDISRVTLRKKIEEHRLTKPAQTL